MKQSRRWAPLLMGLGLGGLSLMKAYANVFPPNCEPVNFAFTQQQLLLNTQNPDHQHLFLIFNSGKEPIDLSHQNANSFVDIGWQTILEPNRWSAFAVNESNYPMTCSMDDSDPNNACQNLQVCQLLKAEFALSNQGSYWVSENRTLRQVLNDTRKKGIVANSSWR
ncbi:MAG: hypothetical protein GKR77_03720 [Legionellales bacterium]|nr:hypothetical protein [Legionellales bacterium]